MPQPATAQRDTLLPVIVPLPLIAAIVGAAFGVGPLGRWCIAVLDTDTRTGADALPRAHMIRAAVAAIAAVGFGLFVWRFGLSPTVLALLAFAAASAVLVVVDVIEHRLPNAIVGWLAVSLATLLVLASAVSGHWIGLFWAPLGALGMFGAYLVLALITPSAMGMGDVKLAFALGLLLAWFGLNAWVLGLFGGFVLGGVVALIALATRRVSLRGHIPFGPSMLAGAALALLLVGP